MAQSELSALRDALRCARSAPCMPLASAAAAAGVRPGLAAAGLRALPARGPCAGVISAGIEGLRSRNENLAAAVLSHPACSPSTARAVWVLNDEGRLDACAAGTTAGWARRSWWVAGTGPLPRSALAALARSGPSALAARRDAVKHSECPPLIMTRMAGTDLDATVRRHAAANPLSVPLRADADSLPGWTYGSEWVRAGVAANPRWHAGAVAGFASDGSWGVRDAAAAHPNIDVAVLEHLASDSSVTVRSAAAANPKLPAERIKHMAVDFTIENSTARRHAARNPSCPPRLVDWLAASTSAAARSAAASRHDVDQSRFIDDPQANVRSAAAAVATDPATLGRFGQDQDLTVVAAAASNRHMDPADLEQLVTHHSQQVRAAAATNPALPALSAQRLATDHDPEVRKAVASHRHTPVRALGALVDDPDEAVRYAAAYALNNYRWQRH